MSKTTEQKPRKVSQAKLSAAISFSLEVKQAFEMYSYRIIDSETFADRLEDLADEYKKIQDPNLD